MLQDAKIQVLAYVFFALSFVIMCTTISTPEHMKAAATIPSDVPSSESNEQISALTSRINELSRIANRANTRYIVSLVLSVVITLGTGAWAVTCQYWAIRDARRVSDAQAELIHVKDLKAAADSREKEQKIADTNKLAGEANERAGEANKEAGRANVRAGELENTAASLRKQNLVTESKLLDAQKNLELEKLTRLELESSLAPRLLEYRKDAQGHENTSGLAPFPGTRVILEVLNDAESLRAAGSLKSLLELSKWEIAAIEIRPDLIDSFHDGVVVVAQLPIKHIPPTPEDMDNVHNARAADALLDFLQQEKWVARKHPGVPERERTPNIPPTDIVFLPPNCIRVVVGFKPSPYFLRPEIKKAFEEMERARQEVRDK